MMSLVHAAFVVIFTLGCASALYFCISFALFDARHRRMRRWPKEHGPTYFTDYKRMNRPQDGN